MKHPLSEVVLEMEKYWNDRSVATPSVISGWLVNIMSHIKEEHEKAKEKANENNPVTIMVATDLLNGILLEYNKVTDRKECDLFDTIESAAKIWRDAKYDKTCYQTCCIGNFKDKCMHIPYPCKNVILDKG